MAATNTALYKDTVELIRLYNTSPAFRSAFNRLLEVPRVAYKGRPLKLYIKLISNTSPIYKIYTQTPINPQNINELFTRVYLDKISFRKLEQATTFPTYIVTPEEHQQIQVIEGLPEGKNKIQAYEQLTNQKTPSRETKLTPQLKPSQESTARKPITSQPTQQTFVNSAEAEEQLETVEEPPMEDAEPYNPQINKMSLGYLKRLNKRLPTLANRYIVRKVPPLKALRFYQAKAKILTNRFLIRHLIRTRLAMGLIGMGLGGGIFGLPGALLGGAGGWFGPSLIGRGAMGWAFRAGSFLTGGGVNVLLALGRLGIAAAVAFPVVTAIVIAGIAIVVLVVVILPTTPPLSTPTVRAATINSCKFIRSGVSQPINSPRLISFIQEVAAKSGVSAAALASVAMHESPDFVIKADDSHDAFGVINTTTPTGCTHFGLPSIGMGSSSTGALGLMQVQPPKHIHDQIAASGKIPTFESVRAYDEPGVIRGASMIGKTVDSLTLQDMCDIRTSLYLGAGVLISKNRGNPPTTSVEVERSVCDYFGRSPRTGTCTYSTNDQFNYGIDAREDFNSCPTLANPTPGSIGFSLTCPLDPINNKNFYVTCGTATNPHPVNKCGHGVGPIYDEVCDPGFFECVDQTLPNGTVVKRYSEALYKAIDVSYPIGESAAQAPVSLPMINGSQTIKWRFIDSVLSGSNSCNWGWKHTYTGSYNGRMLTLILTHLSQQNPIAQPDSNGEIISGSLVGTITSGVGATCQLFPHLHTSIAVDGVWIEPEKEALMCAK